MEDSSAKHFGTTFNSDENEENSFEFRDLMRAMRARWKWFLLSLIVAAGAVTVYLLRATPMYTRSIEVLLKDESAQSIMGDLSVLGVNQTPSEVLNEMFIFNSPEIVEQVVRKLNINEIYSFPKLLRKQEYYNNSPVVVTTVDSLTNTNAAYSFKMEIKGDKSGVKLSKFAINGAKKDVTVNAPFGETVTTPVGTFAVYATDFMDHPVKNFGEQTEIYFTHMPARKYAQALAKNIQAVADEDKGNIVTLTVACTSPKKAEDVLTSVVEAYNQLEESEKKKNAIVTARFIDDRLAAIEQELGDVETSITDYKSNHRMVDLDQMAQLYLTQASENQRQLNELAQEISIGRYLKSELSSNDITRMLPATADIAGTNIQMLVTTYNTLVGERNVKLQSLPEESPLIQEKTHAIVTTREAILASVDAALESLNKRYDAISVIDRQTQAQLSGAPGQARYLMSEERKQKVMESLYVFLLQKREENALTANITDHNIRMVSGPIGPDGPTSPKVWMIVLVAFVVAMLIPGGIIYFRESNNTKVRSRKDIENLPIPFLGEVPGAEKRGNRWLEWLTRRKSNAAEVRKVLVRPHSGNVLNESFRMIRTNIDFMGEMDHRTTSETPRGKTIMVVSFNAGSGKTFVSLNTASIFAIKGKKVCLVDMDLRKGTVSKNVGNPHVGLTDYLVGKVTDLRSLIHHDVDGIEGFDMLPEGVIPPNPTELLYSPNLEKLIEELRSMYDYVVFDCPPVEVVADARLLNPYIDMTIFVMRSGLFEKSDLKSLTELYLKRRYNNMTLILNDTDKVHGVYGTYGYGYGYGYGRSRHHHRK